MGGTDDDEGSSDQLPVNGRRMRRLIAGWRLALFGSGTARRGIFGAALRLVTGAPASHSLPPLYSSTGRATVSGGGRRLLRWLVGQLALLLLIACLLGYAYETLRGLFLYNSLVWDDYNEDAIPSCCGRCVTPARPGRAAFVTTIRTPKYVNLTLCLAASLRRLDPKGLYPLIALTGKDDGLSAADIARLGAAAKVIPVAHLQFGANKYNAKYDKNWLKLRAWQLAEYDALIALDSDMVVLEDVTHLFSLPDIYATALDDQKRGRFYSSLGKGQGGMFLLKPCEATFTHMMEILKWNPRLHFVNGWAEQQFLDWYFKKSRWVFPMKYNAIAHSVPGGVTPAIKHYTMYKEQLLHDYCPTPGVFVMPAPSPPVK